MSNENLSFFTQAKAQAHKVNFELEKKKAQQQNAWIEHHEDLMESLTNLITHDWKAKVKTSADKGVTRVNLFSYLQGARLDKGQIVYNQSEGVSLVYLFKGPKNSYNFWQSYGITPVIERVKELVAPAQVKYWYAGQQSGNVIELDWSNVE